MNASFKAQENYPKNFEYILGLKYYIYSHYQLIFFLMNGN